MLMILITLRLGLHAINGQVKYSLAENASIPNLERRLAAPT